MPLRGVEQQDAADEVRAFTMAALAADLGVMRTQRSTRRVRSRLSLALALTGLLVAHLGCVGACDIVGDSRRLPGGYYVERWREGSYSLGGPTYSADAGGVLKGRVERIGWNDEYIVAWRDPMMGGDKAGWIIVHIKTHAMRGPLTTQGLDLLRKDEPALAGIVPRPTATLWEQ